jgi:hypothetical protein
MAKNYILSLALTKTHAFLFSTENKQTSGADYPRRVSFSQLQGADSGTDLFTFSKKRFQPFVSTDIHIR